MRVVLNTNVLLAALGTRGLCEAVLGSCLAFHEVIISEHIIGQVQRNLTGKFKMPARLAQQIERMLREHCEVCEPREVSSKACRDVSDLPVLGTAVAGKAEYLVTGDADLLKLGRYEGVSIVSPRAFYEKFK